MYVYNKKKKTHYKCIIILDKEKQKKKSHQKRIRKISKKVNI